MDELLSVTLYDSEIATKIESMGAMAVTIANQWVVDWPGRVRALLTAGVYIQHLKAQLDQEQEILEEEANLRHLSPREVLQTYEIRVSPAAWEEQSARLS